MINYQSMMMITINLNMNQKQNEHHSVMLIVFLFLFMVITPPKKQVTPATSPLAQLGFSFPLQSSKLSSSP